MSDNSFSVSDFIQEFQDLPEGEYEMKGTAVEPAEVNSAPVVKFTADVLAPAEYAAQKRKHFFTRWMTPKALFRIAQDVKALGGTTGSKDPDEMAEILRPLFIGQRLRIKLKARGEYTDTVILPVDKPAAGEPATDLASL